jgi:putative DNA primase/helicase
MEMAMKISANLAFQDAKRAGGFEPYTFNDAAGLARIIRKSDHCASVLRDGYRNGENFISCDMLYFDCDGGMSIDDFCKHPDFKDCFFILYTSKSHRIEKNGEPACDRFHGLLPVKTIFDANELRGKLSAMMEKYKWMDVAAKDAARLLYASPGAEIIWHDGAEYQPPEPEKFVDDIPFDNAPPKPKPDKRERWNGTYASTDKRGEIMAQLSGCADAGMFDDQGEWIKLGMALYAEGYTEQDWIGLSWPGVDTQDTADRWRSFDKVRDVTGATLLYYIRQLNPAFMVKQDRTKIRISSADAAGTPIRPEDLPAIDIAMPMELWREDHCVIKYEKDEEGNETDIIKEFKVKPTIEQFRIMLDYYGISIRENLMIHKAECDVPGVTNGGKTENAALGRIRTLCILNNLPVANHSMDSYLTNIAHENKFHPVRQWLDGLTWDGTSRMDALYDTIKEAPGYSKTFKAVLMRKWFLSCVAAIYEDQYTGRGVLTIQGKQGIGKTTWLRSLFPAALKCFKDGLTLDPRSKDSISIAISNWVCELGELEGTFKRADIAALKAFVTMPADTIRMPYERREETYERRTVFAASVNNMIFLGDQTGNSRFWIIQALGLDYQHGIDIDQLWAEILAIYRTEKAAGADAIWWLSQSEESMLSDTNAEHTEMDEFDEIFHTAFEPIADGCARHMTLTEALYKIGYEKPNKFQINKFRDVVLRMGIRPAVVHGKRGFYFPDIQEIYMDKNRGRY